MPALRSPSRRRAAAGATQTAGQFPLLWFAIVRYFFSFVQLKKPRICCRPCGADTDHRPGNCFSSIADLRHRRRSARENSNEILLFAAESLLIAADRGFHILPHDGRE